MPTRVNAFDVGPVRVGGPELFLIAGPCVIENEKLCLQVAAALKKVCRRLGIFFVFKASYDKALWLLERAKEVADHPVLTKSGIIVGLGETNDEIVETMRDLREHGVDVVASAEQFDGAGEAPPADFGLHRFAVGAVADEAEDGVDAAVAEPREREQQVLRALHRGHPADPADDEPLLADAEQSHAEAALLLQPRARCELDARVIRSPIVLRGPRAPEVDAAYVCTDWRAHGHLERRIEPPPGRSSDRGRGRGPGGWVRGRWRPGPPAADSPPCGPWRCPPVWLSACPQ